MPDVTVDKGITLDLISQKKPGTSATNDMPVVETHPDSIAKPAATEAKPQETSDTPDQTDTPSAEPSKKSQGVQKRLDELTRNWREEQRARERTQEQLEKALALLERASAPKPEKTTVDADDPEPAEPDPKKYTDQETFNADYKAYWRNLVKWEARQNVKTLQQQEREAKEKEESEKGRRTALERYESARAKAREKYPDYDAVVHGNKELAITQHMAEAIRQHDNGTDIAYHLGANPQEALRIASLSPYGQLLELGVIAASLKQAPAKPPVSAAPAPIKPLGGSAAKGSVSPEEESMDSYAARRAKELQAERSRKRA